MWTLPFVGVLSALKIQLDRQLPDTGPGADTVSEGDRTSYVRDPDGQLISMVDWAGDERFHYTLDGQNSVLALTAEGSEAESPDAVYEYSPYGEQSSETVEDSQASELNAFGYTGAYQFLDGTVHLSHRFLDTFTLNFTQPDPSRQEMNNSTYARCAPINRRPTRRASPPRRGRRPIRPWRPGPRPAGGRSAPRNDGPVRRRLVRRTERHLSVAAPREMTSFPGE